MELDSFASRLPAGKGPADMAPERGNGMASDSFADTLPLPREATKDQFATNFPQDSFGATVPISRTPQRGLEEAPVSRQQDLERR